MFRCKRRYRNAISIENMTQALLASGMEGCKILERDDLERSFAERRPVKMLLNESRRYWEAIIVSIRYSKMGIFNCIIPVNESLSDNFKE